MALKEKFQGNKSKAAANSRPQKAAAVSPSSDKNTKNNNVALQGTPPALYKRVEVLDAEQHAGLGVDSSVTGFAFTETSDILPLVLAEFHIAQHDYPIVFTKSSPATPMVAVGLGSGRNLFVDNQGNWATGAYIPAYLRCYPFVLAKLEKGEDYVLCADIDSPMLKQGAQPALFKDGKATDTAKQAIQFCNSFQLSANETEQFCKALEAHELLVDTTADIKPNDQRLLSNRIFFRRIDREKLNALPESVILEWFHKGWLAAIYAHLNSETRWEPLIQRYTV